MEQIHSMFWYHNNGSQKVANKRHPWSMGQTLLAFICLLLFTRFDSLSQSDFSHAKTGSKRPAPSSRGSATQLIAT